MAAPIGIAAMAAFPPAWVQNELALCWESLFARVEAEAVEEIVLDIVLGEAEVLEWLVLEVVLPLPVGDINCDVCVVAGLDVTTVGMAV